MFLVVLYLVISTLAEACKGDAANKCDGANCEMVGATQICTECVADNVPINGRCEAAADATGKCTKAAGKNACSSCKDGYFLHKGGCYQFGSTVATLICNDAASSGGRAAVPGVCSECNTAGGFFKNPAASDATHQSCIACSDETGADQYKGRSNCAMCTAPAASGSGGTAKCTKCGNSKYLKTDGTCGEASDCASNTEFAKIDAVNGNKCVSCSDKAAGVADCKTCTAPTEPTNKPTCTECSGDNYLKTVGGVTTCVTKGDCNGAYFPNDNVASKKQCILCGIVANNGIDGCTECALLSSPSRAAIITCSACVSGKKPNTDGSQCIACDIDGCAKCSEASKCSQCGDGYKLEGDTCVHTGGNLSPGAIAGISVAAVVVVGGLVGFLCWWFICRGKA